MRPTGNITGSTQETVNVLQMVSASADFPSTFVLREASELRALGINVLLVQLRPVTGRMSMTGFGDLAPHVLRLPWLSLDTIKAIAFYCRQQPRRVLSYLRLLMHAASQPANLAKMAYVLVASMRTAYSCRDKGIQHVRAHFIHTEALAARFVGGFLRVPFSVTAHTVVLHFPRSVIVEIIRESAFVVADTQQVWAFLRALGAPIEHLHLIRNGVRLDEFPFRSSQAASDLPVILAAGYLIPKKGFHVLLRACAVLQERGVRFRCVLIGDGIERGRLASLREQSGLDGQVEMLGYLAFAQLKDWYYRATVFVIPSVLPSDGSSDGLPTVAIEALACGVPVVGTDTAGIPEAVIDGVTGLIAPPNASEALASRVEALLSQEDLRERLVQEGRRLIESEFNLQQNSRRLADLILSRAARAAPPASHEPTCEVAKN